MNKPNDQKLLARFNLPNRLLSVAEAAQHLGISPRTLLWQHIYTGLLPSLRIGNRYKVHAVELARYIWHHQDNTHDEIRDEQSRPDSVIARAVRAYTGHMEVESPRREAFPRAPKRLGKGQKRSRRKPKAAPHQVTRLLQ